MRRNRAGIRDGEGLSFKAGFPKCREKYCDAHQLIAFSPGTKLFSRERDKTGENVPSMTAKLSAAASVRSTIFARLFGSFFLSLRITLLKMCCKQRLPKFSCRFAERRGKLKQWKREWRKRKVKGKSNKEEIALYAYFSGIIRLPFIRPFFSRSFLLLFSPFMLLRAMRLQRSDVGSRQIPE